MHMSCQEVLIVLSMDNLRGCHMGNLRGCHTANLRGCHAVNLRGCHTANLRGCHTANLRGCHAANLFFNGIIGLFFLLFNSWGIQDDGLQISPSNLSKPLSNTHITLVVYSCTTI